MEQSYGNGFFKECHGLRNTFKSSFLIKWFKERTKECSKILPKDLFREKSDFKKFWILSYKVFWKFDFVLDSTAENILKCVALICIHQRMLQNYLLFQRRQQTFWTFLAWFMTMWVFKNFFVTILDSHLPRSYVPCRTSKATKGYIQRELKHLRHLH